MRISGCLITKNGITCLDRNFINDYMVGYILLRFIEIIAKDVIIKINNTENLNYLSAEIDFS
jgi:hypothetical protein